MRLALFEPDIPQNTGAMMRLCACLGVPMDIIEPCGFIIDDKRLRRSGMDYLDHLDLTRHTSWDAFRASRADRPTDGTAGRIVLLTTRGSTSHLAFRFHPDDTLMVGRESAGVPETVHETADARVAIPMRSGLRSLNVALAAAVVLGEALRQTGGFAEPT